MRTTFRLGGEPVVLSLPESLPRKAVIASGDPLLIPVLERLRPSRLLEVSDAHGLAGLVAAQRGWCARFVRLTHDLVSARMLRGSLGADGPPAGDVVLGEGPADVSGEPFDVVLVHQQRSRALTERHLRQSAALLAEDGAILLAGAAGEGINVSEKVLGELCEEVALEAFEGGVRVLRGKRLREPMVIREPPVRTRRSVEIAEVSLAWLTAPGVFSADGLDPATELLLRNVVLPHRGRILDLGCGGGVIGLWCALKMPEVSVTMLDSDVASVRCAEEGIRLNGLTNARALLSDSTDAVERERFDVVITNPPVHSAGRRDPGLVERFARDAARAVGRRGRLWLVTAPTVPVRRTLDELFTDVRIAADDGSFRLWDAVRRPSHRRERVFR